MTSNYIEDQVDAIRAKIYEKTKHMSNAELAEYFNASARKAAKKYGFTIIDKIPSSTKKPAKKPTKPRTKAHT